MLFYKCWENISKKRLSGDSIRNLVSFTMFVNVKPYFKKRKIKNRKKKTTYNAFKKAKGMKINKLN